MIQEKGERGNLGDGKGKGRMTGHNVGKEARSRKGKIERKKEKVERKRTEKKVI